MVEPTGIVVQKYGGTSLATPERIKQVAARVVEEKKAGKHVIVVVSAMGDSTDRLLDLAKAVSSRPPKRELDMLLTAGERISMSLLSMAISDLGFQAISFTGSQSGIVTDNVHTRAQILDVRAYRVKEELQKGKIVIVAGFQGVSPDKEVTTLGRGGSDTTCVALAAAFNAEKCEIYTDVDGIYTADPRIVPKARKIESISYDEMIEFAFSGAGVLHWRCVDIAKRFGVNIHVRSSFKQEKGTMVTGNQNIETHGIRGITHELDLTRINLFEVDDAIEACCKLLERLESLDIPAKSLQVTTTSDRKKSISITIPTSEIEMITSELSQVLPTKRSSVDKRIASISVIGHGLYSRPGLARHVLECLRSSGIEPDTILTSGITLTVLTKSKDVDSAIRRLHTDLGLDSTHSEEQ